MRHVMRCSELKHIRVGDEVFLKTQVLKKMSEEIQMLSSNMVSLYASGYDEEELTRIEDMVRERAEIILQLTSS